MEIYDSIVSANVRRWEFRRNAGLIKGEDNEESRKNNGKSVKILFL